MTTLTHDRLAGRPNLERAGRSVGGQFVYRPIVCAFALLGVDLVAVIAAAAVTLLFKASLWGAQFDAVSLGGRPAVLDFAMLVVAVIAFLGINGRYSDRTPFWNELRLLTSASFCATTALAAFGLLSGELMQRGPTLSALLLAPVCMTLAHQLIKRALARAGLWTLPVVLIGDGPCAEEAELALSSDPSLGYRVVARVDPLAVSAHREAPRLRPVLNRHRARRLLIALDGADELRRQIVGFALRERIPFAMVSHPFAFPALACDSTRLFGHETVVLSFRDELSRPWSRIVKAAIDITFAALLLVLTSPLFLVIAIANRQDGGPVFYAHRRVGAGGRRFDCLKFRTMVVNADRVLEKALAADPALAAEWSATWKLRDDPRVTRLGEFLRKSSLDELPQLINVIRREMSLVGPRPIVEGEIALYGDDIAQYYAARPGLTGLWQVSGRSNTTYARRVQLDIWYVNNWTVWHDFAVLLKTIPAVFAGEGAR